MVIARSMDYGELLDSLRGGRAALWSCRTCARLCGLAGDEAVERLERRLLQDGVEMSPATAVSASCLQDKVGAKISAAALDDAETVVALCCDIGAEMLASALPGKRILLPTVTLGQGARAGDGTILLCRSELLEVPEGGLPAEEACRILGLSFGPFA